MKTVIQITFLFSIMVGLIGCSSAPVGRSLYERAGASSINPKIATLDVQRALLSSKPGQKHKAELDKEYTEAKVTLDQQEKAVKTSEDRYRFRTDVAAAQKKIEASEKLKVDALIEYIRSKAQKIAERDGFDKIVESESKKGYPDITDETIQALNQL